MLGPPKYSSVYRNELVKKKTFINTKELTSSTAVFHDFKERNIILYTKEHCFIVSYYYKKLTMPTLIVLISNYFDIIYIICIIRLNLVCFVW